MNIWLYWENKPGSSIPPYIEMCRESVIKHGSSSFDVVIVTPENIHEYLPNIRTDLDQIRRKGDAPDKINIPIKTAYIRVELLYHYGGVWLDSDMVLINNFNPIHTLLSVDNYNFVCYFHWFGYVVNNFLASQPKGKVITEYKNKLDSIINERKILIWGEAGARTITPIATSDNNTFLFSKKAFHPIHYKDKDKFFRTDLFPEDFMDASTICFALFNDLFPEDFKKKSREDILKEDTLISKIFRLAIGEQNK